jgi:cell division septum initiation protein DivIVA
MTVLSRTDERLTPDQVQTITFPSARLGRRGCDEDHVRAFCIQVENELVTLINERTALWEEVQRLRRRIMGEDGDMAFTPADAQAQAVRILSNAQQTADRYVADAQQYSRQLAEDARQRHDEVVAEARQHANRLIERVHEQGMHAAPPSEQGPLSDGERAEAQAELAYLRTFSDVYRTHLRAYLEALMRNVDDWERTEKASLAAARGEPLPPPPPSPPGTFARPETARA